MTKDKFEKEYALRSSMSTSALKSLGLAAVPCDCKEKGCQGWQMERDKGAMVIKEFRVSFTGRFTKKDQMVLLSQVAEFANQQALDGFKLTRLKRKDSPFGANDFQILFFLEKLDKKERNE
jgi:hypothetical protein